MSRRKSGRRGSVRRTAVSTSATVRVAGLGRAPAGPLAKRVHEAAEIIADAGSADIASYPSESIPPSIVVTQGTAATATIWTNARAAYPIASGSRHPVFGMTGKANDIRLRNGGNIADLKPVDWFPMKQRRFLENGAVAAGTAAAEALAMVIDDWASARGFET